MRTNYIQEGKSLDYTNKTEAAIAAGDIVVMGSVVGVAGTDIAVNATGSVHVVGVFEVLKEEGLEIGQGEKVYWNATGGVMTKTSASNTLAGYAAYTAKTTDVTVKVKLVG